MNYVRHKFLFLALLILVTQGAINAFDNGHFYRAPYFYGEPRFECPWLTSLEFSVAGGASSTGYNGESVKVPLLDIYGISNMQALGKNVVKDPANTLDLILTLLERLPSRSTFGQMSFSGNFDIAEGLLLFTQNFNCGLFAQAILPLRRLQIANVSYTDLSPDDTFCPNKYTPEWQAFLSKFNDILLKYHLNITGSKESGIGDLTLLGGWTTNYNDTDWLDFVDATVKLGVLCPTGKKADVDNAFSLPLGYNGHTAITLAGSLAFGLYEWLTFGIFADSLFFFKATNDVRIKTAAEQAGFIKLTRTRASVKPGTLWDAGCYAKADHFCRGLSLLLAYQFTMKCNDSLTLCPPTSCYDLSVVNSDAALRAWKQHTFHALVECDFTQEDARFGSRLNLFYNYLIRGKHVFNTSMGGASVGFELAFDF